VKAQLIRYPRDKFDIAVGQTRAALRVDIGGEIIEVRRIFNWQWEGMFNKEGSLERYLINTVVEEIRAKIYDTLKANNV